MKHDVFNNPIFYIIFASCFFIFFLVSLLLIQVRLKNGRYKIVEGRVVSIEDSAENTVSLRQKGRIVTVEYFYDGERYTADIGKFQTGNLKMNHGKTFYMGERLNMICDVKNPSIVYRKSSPFLYLGLIISAVILIFSIVNIIPK